MLRRMLSMPIFTNRKFPVCTDVAYQVAGMLVMNAHSVTDSSGEGFAVRLFRKGNQRGFVRAMSDQPQSFASGFSKVQKCRPCRPVFITCVFTGPR